MGKLMLRWTCMVGLAVGAAAFAAEPSEAPVEAAAPPETSDADTTVDTGAVRQTVRDDRLELDTTVVTGNRELPKVLYIVPWKKADLGDLPAQPFNTLLDEVLTPVDRDVFRREVTYFEVLSGDGDGAASMPSTPGARAEK